MKKVTIEQVRQFGVILGVAFVGLFLFNFLFSYLYKDPLAVSSCELCFELNPALKFCSENNLNLKPINFSDPNLNLTFVSYGRKT